MANEVFANGLEIACKRADGKSIACFPDPCWTPGWSIVPYANTAFAKDTDNASKTVFISGKPIMKKDVSYFKKSIGNEPASGPKGQFTGVKKGKAYFTSWSMNVKVEGQNVDRHTDGMTHNHGSVTGNTGTWKYIDTKTRRGACRKDFERVEKKCKPKKKRGNKRVPDRAKGAWKKAYCKGLNFKPPNADNYDPAKIKEQLEELSDISKQTAGMMQAAKDAALEKAKEFAAKTAGKLVAKSALKAWLGPIGWAWTAYDVVSTGLEVKEIYSKLEDMQKEIEELKKLPDKIKDIQEKGLTPESMADAQAVVAASRPCLRARKCMLVPYKRSEQAGKGNRDSGCCPGQTAHHLVPKSQFKATSAENSGKVASCPNYDEDKAPCICVEGTSHSRGGTHQVIHNDLEPRIEAASDANGEISYKDAKENANKSMKKIAPQCSSACIKAQLDKYHKDACNQESDNFKLRSSSAKSSKVHTGIE